jgi:hypothetical protein
MLSKINEYEQLTSYPLPLTSYPLYKVVEFELLQKACLKNSPRRIMNFDFC